MIISTFTCGDTDVEDVVRRVPYGGVLPNITTGLGKMAALKRRKEEIVVKDPETLGQRIVHSHNTLSKTIPNMK